MTRDESGPRSTAKDLNGAMVQAAQRAVQSMGKRRILQLDPEDEHTREQRLKLFPDRAGHAGGNHQANRRDAPLLRTAAALPQL